MNDINGLIAHVVEDKQRTSSATIDTNHVDKNKNNKQKTTYKRKTVSINRPVVKNQTKISDQVCMATENTTVRDQKNNNRNKHNSLV